MAHRTLYSAILLFGLGTALVITLLADRSGEAVGSAPTAPAPFPAGSGELLSRVELEESAQERTAPAREPSAPPIVPPTSLATRDEGDFDETGVYGRLADEQVRPIAGARVLLFSGDSPLFAQTKTLAETTSDEEGRYRFVGLQAVQGYYVYAQAEGFRPGWLRHHSGHDEEFRLRAAASIRGRALRAESEKPLQGVRISAEVRHWRAGAFHDEVSCLTEADGFYELPWLRLDRFQKIIALEPGGAPSRHDFQIDPDQHEGYDLYLGRGRPLTLEFFDPVVGQVLAGFPLRVEGLDFVTDSNGHIDYDFVEEKEDLFITVESEGHCRTSVRHRRTEFNKRLVRVPMTRGASVVGRVLDAHGNGVAGAYLVLRGRPRHVKPPGFPLNTTAMNTTLTLRSGAGGAFEITGIAPSEHIVLRARHAEYGRSAEQILHLPRMGLRAEVELTLAAPGTIEGTIRIDGAPSSVDVHWSAGDADGRGRSNDRGFYRLNGVPPGETHVWITLDQSWNNLDHRGDLHGHLLYVKAEAVLEHDIEVTTDRIPISGFVRDTVGIPLAGVAVSASARHEGERYSTLQKTRADGSFHLLVHAVGGMLYHLGAYQGQRAVNLEDVVPGTVDIELVLPDLGLVRLRVVDAFTRKSVRGYRVYYRQHAEQPLTMLRQSGSRFSPGPEGSFLAKLPTGSFELVVCARDQGYVEGRVERVHVATDSIAQASVSLEPGMQATFEFKGSDKAIQQLKSHLRRKKISILTEEQRLEKKRQSSYFNREIRKNQALVPADSNRAVVEGLSTGTYSFQGIPRGLSFKPASIEIAPRNHQEFSIRVETKKARGNGGDPRR
ncbi:MAG: hypothetical protein CMJ89_19515 [Planctomycetes bacterium]|jgi:hypothetical protein|nr:hypothetical protein [Planctomycetota bacterium]